jgi:hypothetical protein
VRFAGFEIEIGLAPRNRKKGENACLPGPRHEDCWAKTTKEDRPGINVRDHCLNVGCVAEALIALLPARLKSLLPRGAATLAALHDIGKVSPGFQMKCADWCVRHPLPHGIYEQDHAKVSQFTVRELLGASVERATLAIDSVKQFVAALSSFKALFIRGRSSRGSCYLRFKQFLWPI